MQVSQRALMLHAASEIKSGGRLLLGAGSSLPVLCLAPAPRMDSSIGYQCLARVSFYRRPHVQTCGLRRLLSTVMLLVAGHAVIDFRHTQALSPKNWSRGWPVEAHTQDPRADRHMS